jgi:alpha-mannosidase
MTNKVTTPAGLSGPVVRVLNILRAAADEAERGWFPEHWTIRAGDRSSDLRLAPVDSFVLCGGLGFQALHYEPGAATALSARFEPPALVAGVPMTGEALLMSMNSLYPVSVEANGRAVFQEVLPPVAFGPAQFTAWEALEPGSGPELTITVRPQAAQTVGHSELSFTTPALWERFLLLDTAWAQLALAASLAVTDEDYKSVEAAVLAVPPAPLELSREDLAAALSEIETALLPIAPRVAERRVHAIGHSHIDLQWMWTWADAKEVVKRDVASVLAIMDDFPEMRFTHSQPAGYDVLRREEPDLFAGVCDRVAEGRWEPATMQWVECDVNMPSSEAQARQLLEGVGFTRRYLKTSPHVHLAPDTFGHVGNLPQLTVSAGAKVYYHHRGNPGQASGGRMWPAYWWTGDDGTRVLALSSPVYLGPVTPGRVAQDVLAQTGEGELTSCVYFYGVGDHGGGPVRRDLETMRQMQGTSGLPSIFCSTVGAFAEEVIASGVPLPEHRSESPTIFEGCYTSQADVKFYNRAVENELVAAEALCALAGVEHTAELTELWRTALFHQFHDIICGSAIADARQLSAGELARVLGQARGISDRALATLAREVPAGEVAVTNPIGCDRQEVVVVPDLAGEGVAVLVDEHGTRVAAQRGTDGLRFVASVPAFATSTYRLTNEAPEVPAVEVREANSRYFSVDTPYFFAMVGRGSGIITTLYDKVARRELVGYNIARAVNFEQVRPDLCLGVLQLFDERPHGMSSWVVDDIYAEQSLIDGAEVRVAEAGPVRVVLESSHAVRSSSIVKRVVFFAAIPRIDIELEVSWNEPGGPHIGIPNLALSFGTRLSACEAVYETPFGADSRPADGLVVPGLRWAHIGNPDYGMALLNDSKYGFDALGSRLRAHVVRSSYEPDTVSDCGTVTKCAFAVVPHAGDWRDARLGELAAGFNTPLRGRAVGATAGATVASGHATAVAPEAGCAGRPHLRETSTVVIDALKYAARGDGAVVVRLHESAGRPARARLAGLPAGATVLAANIVEDVTGRLETAAGAEGDIEVALGFRPFEVKTLLVQAAENSPHGA